MDVEAFKDPLVVIANLGMRDCYLEMIPQQKWPAMCRDWIVAPHEVIPLPNLQEDDSIDSDVDKRL